MSRYLETIFLSFLIILFVNTGTATRLGRCEKVKIPFCQGLGYNETIFPNNLEHENQEEALSYASEFTSLIDSQCSSDLVYFLCSLFSPVCTVMKTALPPCRSLCKSARNGCEELMNKYGFKWPKDFACDRFPKFGQSLCVGRNSSSSTEGSQRKSDRRSGKKTPSLKLHRKQCSSSTGQGKLCCKLGRRASKKGFDCKLKRIEKTDIRSTSKFRKTVIKKCSKYSFCFDTCCKIHQLKRGSNRNAS